MTDNPKRQAAAAAMRELQPGMRLGLGTGSTAREFVALLGEKIAAGFDCLCVPTSEETAIQARALNIPLGDLETNPQLDLTIDGADEIGPGLCLIKGGGGALLREKIVAAASSRMIVIADARKLVPVLGHFPLPIEVNSFGLGATRRALDAVLACHKASGPLVLRLDKAGRPFITDGGHLILDALFGRISAPEALARDLQDVPGVVQHGLFLGLCKRAYVADTDGVKILDA